MAKKRTIVMRPVSEYTVALVANQDLPIAHNMGVRRPVVNIWIAGEQDTTAVTITEDRVNPANVIVLNSSVNVAEAIVKILL